MTFHFVRSERFIVHSRIFQSTSSHADSSQSASICLAWSRLAVISKSMCVHAVQRPRNKQKAITARWFRGSSRQLPEARGVQKIWGVTGSLWKNVNDFEAENARPWVWIIVRMLHDGRIAFNCSRQHQFSTLVTNSPPIGDNLCAGKKPELSNVQCATNEINQAGKQPGANMTANCKGSHQLPSPTARQASFRLTSTSARLHFMMVSFAAMVF